MKKSFFLPIFILSITSHVVLADSDCHWPKIVPLKSGNLISTYTFDFWNYAEKNLKDIVKKSALLEEGAVVGDFHFSNVGLYFNAQTNQAEPAIVDLDDAGEASYLADYAKYLAYLKSITKAKDLDQKSLLKNYVKGLYSESFVSSDQPSKISDLYLKKRDWFIDKNNKATFNKINSSQTGFGKKENLKNVNSLNLDVTSLIKSIPTDIKVLDMGSKENESGSSMGAVRIELLGQEAKTLGLYEFKELRCPGVQKFKPQVDQYQRFSKMKQALKSEMFWGASYIATAKDKSGQNESYFIFRKKQENAMEALNIDHLIDKELVKFAEYYAFLLGYYHSKTAPDSYRQAVQESAKDLVDKLDQFSKDYLKHLDKKTKE